MTSISNSSQFFSACGYLWNRMKAISRFRNGACFVKSAAKAPDLEPSGTGATQEHLGCVRVGDSL